MPQAQKIEEPSPRPRPLPERPLPERHIESDLDQLGERIAELAAQITAATYQLLVLIAEFDAREGWNRGFASCAHWLSWRTGLALGPAREKVRVARALAELPRLSAAMRRGELSYSKLRALTRVATPDNEEELLLFARAGTATHVERLVRAWRRCDRLEEAEIEGAQIQEAHHEARRHASRYLSLWTDEDGMVVVRGRLDPEAGAGLIKAVEAAADLLYDEEKERETATQSGVPAGQRRADALGRVAEAALAGGLDKGTRGDRYQVVVHVDAAVLSEPEAGGVPAGTSRNRGTRPARVPTGTSGTPAACGSNVPAGTSSRPATLRVEKAAFSPPAFPGDVPAGTSREKTGLPPRPRPQLQMHPFTGQSALETGASLPAETARRLACDASKVVMIHDPDGNPLDLGRRTRIISPALRRALAHRDRSCRFPGCHVTFCDAHHVKHWAHGGETSLDNLVLLCSRHHRCVHEEGYRIEQRPGSELRFLRPDGKPIPDAPPLPALPDDALTALAESLTEAGVDLERMPAYPEWDGSSLDLAWAVDALRSPAGAAI